jgi:hypothetical protein
MNNIKNQIKLEKGKIYMPFLARNFMITIPIVELFKDYNPILIQRSNFVDYFQGNSISVDLYENSTFDEFAKACLASNEVMNLFEQLKKHQGNVYVKPWENVLSLKPLFDDPQIHPLGLTPEEEEELQEIWADPKAKLKFLLKIKKLIKEYNSHVKKDLKDIADIKDKIFKIK